MNNSIQVYGNYNEEVTRVTPSPLRQRQDTVGSQQQTPAQNQQSRNKSYRERYKELNAQNENDLDGEYPDPYAEPMDTEVPSQIHTSPGPRRTSTYITPFENSRMRKDFSSFASKLQKNHRRFVFLGDYEVGKTSLWLRYIFYDQKRANISVQQTPKRDGYIFEKSLADGYTNYSI